MRISDWSSDVCSSDLVSTPEATALDLVRYMKQSGGISRVVQIIADLAPQMKVPAFKGALEAQPEITVIQRAGFILDALGRPPLARCAAEADRKAVVRGTGGEVGVDLGGRGTLK